MPTDAVVLGLDPGTTLGWAVVGHGYRLRDAGELQLKGRSQVEEIGLVGQLLRDLEAQQHPVLVVIEDVSQSVMARSSGFRHPKSIGSIQRRFATLYATAIHTLGVERVKLAPVATWYPRQGGVMLKKPKAVEYLRAKATRVYQYDGNPLAADEARKRLKNEHRTMAYGLACYGWARWPSVRAVG